MTGKVAAEAEVIYRAALTDAEKADVMSLRDSVYVQDQGRLITPQDMVTTFDRYDKVADYLVAYLDGQPAGTIKMIPDTEAGLPCEDAIDIGLWRGLNGARLVEFGHLMTVPELRNKAIGLGLMRAALVHCLLQYRATHILGDFFIDDLGRLRDFYTLIGFVPVGEPYRDARFKGSPLSVVAALDLAEAARRARSATGKAGDLLTFFFHDYDELAGGA